TDIAKITRKPDKNRHENGKSTQEPGIIKKSQPKLTLVNIGSDSSLGQVHERRLVKMEITACFWSDGFDNFVRLSNGGLLPLRMVFSLVVELKSNGVGFDRGLFFVTAIRDGPGITIYGSELLIHSDYAPSMSPLLSLSLSMACKDSQGCLTMAMMNLKGYEKVKIIHSLTWQRIAFAAMAAMTGKIITFAAMMGQMIRFAVYT
nr:hypothetical protein [Tanacetum cinerariifolium]